MLSSQGQRAPELAVKTGLTCVSVSQKHMQCNLSGIHNTSDQYYKTQILTSEVERINNQIYQVKEMEKSLSLSKTQLSEEESFNI